MKNGIRGRKIFHPDMLTKACNSINSVKASLINHDDNDVFRTGWNALLSKYFRNIPEGFTGSYFFEFDNGQCGGGGCSLMTGWAAVSSIYSLTG
jgi:hypothetical protein